jgi:hypothetical protein
VDIIEQMIGTCTCLTKTPDIQYHDDSCLYKRLALSRDNFEQWFLSIPDADETLLNKNKKGDYKDLDIGLAYYAFVAGVKS